MAELFIRKRASEKRPFLLELNPSIKVVIASPNLIREKQSPESKRPEIATHLSGARNDRNKVQAIPRSHFCV